MARPKPEDVDGDYDHSRKPAKDIMKEYYEDSLSPARKRKIHFNRVNRSGKGDMEPVGLAPFKDRKGGKPTKED
jgi:hypothetical protein